MNERARVVKMYAVLFAEVAVNQYEGEELEVWKYKKGGYYFVYCGRLGIGYWAYKESIEFILE